jgi:anti-sigma factor RsiW
MACEQWLAQLDAYLDSELAPAESRALIAHVRTCGECAAQILQRVQIKRSLLDAGRRYQPSAEFRASITKNAAAKPSGHTGWAWKIIALPAVLVLLLSVTVNWYLAHERTRRQALYSELTDMHVGALASVTPVEILSTDRHTVKPWFQGKIPFTFNLPELQGSEFTLLGGRLAFLAQAPGAQLIYQVRKHEVSVFIFQDRADAATSFPSSSTHALSFNVESWTANGLKYFVIGNVGSDDVHALANLLRSSE